MNVPDHRAANDAYAISGKLADMQSELFDPKIHRRKHDFLSATWRCVGSMPASQHDASVTWKSDWWFDASGAGHQAVILAQHNHLATWRCIANRSKHPAALDTMRLPDAKTSSKLLAINQ